MATLTGPEGAAVVHNFNEMIQWAGEMMDEIYGTEAADEDYVETFLDTMHDMSHDAQNIPGHRPGSEAQYTGFAHRLDAEIDYLKQKYGEAILGTALKAIEDGFAELAVRKFFYWTTDTEIQNEQEDLYNKFKAELVAKMEELNKAIENAIQASADEIRSRVAQSTDRARQALETAAKYDTPSQTPAASTAAARPSIRNIGKAFISGLKGTNNIGSTVKGLVNRIFRKR